MIITIKAISEELKDDGNPKHIEWEVVSADGKEIKVKLYPTLQIDENWLHFEDRWDEFKNAHNKSYDIERANIKVEKGYWKPIIKATEVKDVFLKKAQEQLQTGREQSIETQVAIKEVGEDLRTKTRDWKDPLVIARELWLMTHLGIEREVKDDKAKEKAPKNADKEALPEQWTVKDYVEALRNQDYKAWWRDWAKQNKVEGKPTLEATLEAMNITQLYELKKKLKGGECDFATRTTKDE